MRVSVVRLVFCLAVSIWILGSAALAQSTTPKPNPAKPGTGTATATASEGAKAAPQPWVVNCAATTGKAELNCSMVQTIFSRANGLRLIAVAISKLGGDSKNRLQLSLPHGVALQNGTQIWVDKGKKLAVPIRNADANGSYAITEINTQLLDSLRKGVVLNTAFKSLDGQQIVLQISLNGFTAAFAKL